MRTPLVSTLAIFAVAAWVWVRAAEAPRYLVSHNPVLVELFTSEGCSSYLPVDALHSKFDRQSRTGAEIVVLSEHVDYWNDLGWKDPYSSHVYSDRQNTYADRLALSSVYTPQMVVDGSVEFVGSSARSANDAFARAFSAPKIPIHLSSITLEPPDILRAHIETEALTHSFGERDPEVYVAVALDHAESEVSRGENGGRRLVHTAVVRTLFKIGSVQLGQSFPSDVQLKLESGTDTHNLVRQRGDRRNPGSLPSKFSCQTLDLAKSLKSSKAMSPIARSAALPRHGAWQNYLNPAHSKL